MAPTPRWGYLPDHTADLAAHRPKVRPTVSGDPASDVPASAEPLVGVAEAAELLGVSPQWVRRQAADGLLGARQVSGRWLLERALVAAEAERRRSALERRLPAGTGRSAPRWSPTAAAAMGAADRPPASGELEAGTSQEWERESWALERQLLIAQADASQRDAQLARLEAAIGQRDATIAMLQSELGRLRSDRDRWQLIATQLLATFSASEGDGPGGDQDSQLDASRGA
jgi:hypothetical protein